MNELTPLTENKLQSIKGGLILVHPDIAFYPINLIYKTVVGSYQSGYDAAQNNCACQN